MNNEQLSELNFGLIIDERVPVTMYKSVWFSAPYDRAVELLLQKGATREDLAKVISSSYLTDAHNSVKRMNGLGESMDWAKTLQTSYYNVQIGDKLQKFARKLKENDPVDLLPLYGEIGSLVSNESTGLTQASTIDAAHYRPFIKSGNPVLDKILGGIPADGPIIVYGPTGVGKSHWAASMMDYLLHEYPDKTGGIYTLEMGAEHYLWRELNMFPSLKDVLDRLYVSGSVRDIEEFVAEVTAKRLDFVVLDDMDNVVKSSDASEYECVYRRIKEICRFLKIPVFVLCQPNREAKHAIERGERFLGRYDIAWSGGAENSAALQVALQRVSSSLDMEATTFPTEEGEELYYEIFWKSRDGWPSDYSPEGQTGPGAIVRTKSKQAWRGNPYSGKYKLWQPNSSGKKIGKKRKTED
jgi:hypothetical protein